MPQVIVSTITAAGQNLRVTGTVDGRAVTATMPRALINTAPNNLERRRRLAHRLAHQDRDTDNDFDGILGTVDL